MGQQRVVEAGMVPLQPRPPVKQEVEPPWDATFAYPDLLNYLHFPPRLEFQYPDSPCLNHSDRLYWKTSPRTHVTGLLQLSGFYIEFQLSGSLHLSGLTFQESLPVIRSALTGLSLLVGFPLWI